MTEAHSSRILIVLEQVPYRAPGHSGPILGADEQRDPQLRALTPSPPEVESKVRGHLHPEHEGKAKGEAASFLIFRA